ncbi:probable 28S ribosomal protein S10, mitochondrial isoform X2 [Ooceraea biroi]|uniref:probable 28S ribosomal protein S10, mitochondrial isoform X2 n=1 Tax=Ooceraea biroi TaxID=2015173 RepID=UPI0009716DB1|nr:probable 28S ribosomal protein S10, mitochondrial isoform X2 [Ooceraea biroi]
MRNDRIAVLGQRPSLGKVLSAKMYTGKLYEPDYLETGKSKVPMLPSINIQIKGYDYPVLESYQALMYKLANAMQIDVDDSWALPAQVFKIEKFKTRTTVIETKYDLKIFERNMQVSEISTAKCSVLIRVLEAALPQGVTLNVDVFDPALEKKRYVPDKELLDLKSTLENLKK